MDRHFERVESIELNGTGMVCQVAVSLADLVRLFGKPSDGYEGDGFEGTEFYFRETVTGHEFNVYSRDGKFRIGTRVAGIDDAPALAAYLVKAAQS